METIKEYLDQIRVFQYRLKRPPEEIDFGGVFIIRATTKYEDDDNVTHGVTAPYCVSDRQCLLDLHRTKELLGHAFEELFMGRSFTNLNSLVDNLAEDLLCQFRFSPEFLNREDTPPVIVSDLIIPVERGKSDNHDDPVAESSETVQTLIMSENEAFHDDEEIKVIEDEIEDYLKNSPERINDEGKTNTGLYEIKPALKVKKFAEADQNQGTDEGDHSMVKFCSICLDKLSEGEVVAETTACSHMFHRACVLNWLIRADSCPEKMEWNGPYFINVYWRSKYVIEDGTIRTFDNRADGTLFIERKLSYSEFFARICDKAGWDRYSVNLRITLLFETNEAGPSRSSEDRFITEAQGRYENNGRDSVQDDESDGTYIESEEESDYETSVADETGNDDAEEEPQQQQAEKLITSYQECITRKTETPPGQSTCGWRMHASRKAHGLFEMVSWTDRHNCVGRTTGNDNRNITTGVIARLIMRNVETDPDYLVRSIRDDVKKHYKYWEKFCEYENTAAGHDVEVYDEPNLVYKVTTALHRGGKGQNVHTVEYSKARCTCKKWQTYRLSCSHALRVCREIGDHPENIIHEYHKTTTWHEQFRNPGFMPVARKEEWTFPSWNLVPDYKNLVLYRGPGRIQKRRYMMAMDYRGRRRRCRRCGATDHKTRECPRSYRRADRTRINVNWDADGFEGVEELWAWERIPVIQPQRQCDEEFFKDHAFGARLSSIEEGPSSNGLPLATDDYLLWYQSRTVRFSTDPSKYDQRVEGFLHRAKLYKGTLNDILKKVETYKAKKCCSNATCEEFFDSISVLAENALSIVPTEMPTLYPSQVVLQIQPKRPITAAKYRRANIPKAGIGGRKKVVESNEFLANLFQTPSPQEQTMFTGEQTMFTMEQEQTTTEQGIEIEVTPTIEQDAEFQASQTLQQSSLPLAKRKQDRKHRPPKEYTPSRSTPPSPEE
ncbi:OLC1v1035423C1 [Oldenlandia corymbosa var. corymbosa]|uniref:OLC1v1035423C1 n=1 Tax=Oldenlandia corymbosa var. corymbosa TaxID=529605 RepID=A0AAV1CSY4_OLDCO|nr:OLC1v1035423C1 [Oldenlandia corymbosa var. corymbosa]